MAQGSETLHQLTQSVTQTTSTDEFKNKHASSTANEGQNTMTSCDEDHKSDDDDSRSPHLQTIQLAKISSLNSNSDDTSHQNVSKTQSTNNTDASHVYIILYYILRFFTVTVTLFLAIMAINYAIGQVLNLEAADLFCEDHDEETLRNYNLKHNITGGSKNCGKIHRTEIDADKVSNGDPYEYVTHFNTGNVLTCVAFSVLALCFTVLGFYHLYMCFHDAFYHFIRCDAKNNPRLLRTVLNAKIESKYKVVTLLRKWSIWMMKHNYPDSKMKIILMICSEISEIITQCWALLIYGGVQSVSFSFVIANESRFVKSFATIVGTNCILAGLLWIFYVLNIKKIKALFHGTEFQAIVFVNDMIFDFAYTIFPFTLYAGDSSSLLFNFKALATLHTENGILFFAAFIAMVLLLKKCHDVLSSFDPVHIAQTAQKMSTHKIRFIPYLQAIHHDDDQIWRKQQRTRRLCIGSVGVLFVLFGATLITVVTAYLNKAHEICSNPSAKLLAQHPELYYWKTNCKSKLTPFDTSDTPCDCRMFQIWFTTKHFDEYNFSKHHVTSIMSNFKMMHFLEINYDHHLILHINHMENDGQSELVQELFYLNVTADCFASKHLRSFELYRIFLIDLDWESLAFLKFLQVLQISAARYENPINWESIGQLTALTYLKLSESMKYLDDEITESICRLTALRYLNIETNFITKIPDCIAGLTQLHGVNLRGLINLDYITPQLFQLPNIVSIVGYYSGFNASSVPVDGQWSKSLQNVFLQETALCDQVSIMTPAQLTFMEQFEPCHDACKLSNVLQGTCATYDWGNGHCDSLCCNYDGGDCHQTCDCHHELWFNDQCDLECNNSLCAYDFGSCLTETSSNFTECAVGSGCDIDWIDDGWCDLNCAVLADEECADELDCDPLFQCDQYSGCATAYLYIIHTLAAQNDPKELIDLNEACGVFWDWISVGFKDQNCSEAFPIVDANHDGFISFWEALQMAHSFFGLTKDKMYQIDCSLCLDDPSLYY